MHKKVYFIIFLVVFVDLLGFGIVIPILPYYAKTFGANATLLGFLMMIYSAMQFIFAPFWGRLSDQIGRRPVLLISILGTSFSMLLVGFAPSLFWLFAGRAFAGFCGANVSTAMAYIADISSVDSRAKGMGMIGAAFGLGFIFGPVIGGLLSYFGYNTPIFFAAFLALLNFVFAWFQLREPALKTIEREQNRVKRGNFDSLQKILKNHPQIRITTILFFIVTFAFTQMEVSFAYFMKARFNYDAVATGWLLAFVGAIAAIIQGIFIGLLVKKQGEKKLVFTGTLFMALGLFMLGNAFQLPILILALAVMGIGHAINNPSLSSLTSQAAPVNQHGLVLGIYQSAGSLARILGPPVAGWLFDQCGIHTPFFVSAALMLLSSFIAFKKLL